jgi:phytoene dehydrogenase-like protein
MMNQHSPSPEVVVVGGGLAGLAAAALVARAGHRVMLFEKSNVPGGRAVTHQAGGFSFNLGPHALYDGGPGIEILRSLDVPVRGAHPPASGYLAVRDGVKHTFPVGFLSLLTTSLFNLSERIEAARFLAGLPRIDPEPLQGRTVRDWVEETARHPRLRAFLYTLVRLATYTDAPDRLSAGTALAQLQQAAASGVYYLDGGWQVLVDGLLQAARAAGVELVASTRIDAVEDDGAVRGVRLADGRRIDASAVIVAASPGIAAGLIPEPKGSSLRSFAASSVPVRAACLDLGLSRLPNRRALVALAIDRPLYLSVHSAVARLAPDGGAMIHAAKYLPPGGHTDARADEEELEALVDRVQPGWREALVERRFLPQLIVANAMDTAARGGAPERPGIEVPELPGLFLAGDWIGPDRMLADAALGSAGRAAAAVHRYLEERREEAAMVTERRAAAAV